MRFQIQTINGRIKHDFSFVLIESCEYHNWINRNNDFQCFLTDEETVPDLIPIGSVEFVSKYLLDHHGLIPKPKNVPQELMKEEFCGRTIFNGTDKDFDKSIMFVKSNDRIKSFTEIVNNSTVLHPGSYQFSSLVNITSEWRTFVYQGRMVGLQNYSGEFDIFPDVAMIKKMVSEYKQAPISYTLDVGVLDNGRTVIVEVHDFFSCGLYGFQNHKLLPFMFSRWFNEFINKWKK